VEDTETNLSLLFTPSVSTVFIRLSSSSTTGDTADFDNISVFEVDANDDVIHTMPKGWKPKDVFEDGLLQREGAAHDYTVVYDGFDYVVKPAVAPTATTQTCVIGVRA
jgi:flagellar basal body rod protein FlgF